MTLFGQGTGFPSKSLNKKSAKAPPTNLLPRYLRYAFLLAFVGLLFLMSEPRPYDVNIDSLLLTPSTTLQTSTPSNKWKLRFDWSNLAPQSPLAQRMLAHQTNCSLPLGNFVYRNRYGLGSDLHVWGQALCNGMESRHRIRTVAPWTWMDQEKCGPLASPMACYFSQSELNCEGDEALARQYPIFTPDFHNISRHNGNVKYQCDSIMKDDVVDGVVTTTTKSQLRASATEFLFGHVSPLVVQEAERQLALVFEKAGQVPKDLITVHIRWGDKEREMQLVPIYKYIQAIQRVLRDRPKSSTSNNDKTVNIFLATEDPQAVQEFQNLAPSEWNIYVDQYYTDMLPYRVSEYNGSPKMAAQLNGRTGLVALGSLLVAMEANDFILTTASNWSRLFNELRKSIVNPRCYDCTTMADLRPDKNEW
jgi:hypothetical protein